MIGCDLPPRLFKGVIGGFEASGQGAHGLVELVGPAGERLHGRIRPRRFHHDGLTGVLSLEHDGPQLTELPLEAVDPAILVGLRRSPPGERRRQRDPGEETQTRAREGHGGYCWTPAVSAEWALRLCAQASSPVPGSMGCSLP